MPNVLFPEDLVVAAKQLILTSSGAAVPRAVSQHATQFTTATARLSDVYRSLDTVRVELSRNSRATSTSQQRDLFSAARNLKAQLDRTPTILQIISDLIPVVDGYAANTFPAPEQRFTDADIEAELRNLTRCESFTDVYLYKRGNANNVPAKLTSDMGRRDSGDLFLSVKTPPITLRHDGRVIPLNEFYIVLNITKLGNILTGDLGYVNIVAHNPNYPGDDTSHPHPHVSGTGLCFGEGKSAFLTALARCSYVDAFEIILAVLNNYNGSSPYMPIENWASNTCTGCGAVLTDTVITIRSAPGRAQKYCPNCAFKCAKTNEYFTNRHKYVCTNCNSAVHTSKKAVIPAGPHNPETACCAVCSPQVLEGIARAGEAVAANAPTYTCASCNAVTERASLPEGHAWPPVMTCIDKRPACPSCAVATKLMGVPAVICRRHGPDFTIAPDNSHLAVKHYTSGELINIPITRVRCDCGAEVLPHLRRHDPFMDKHICQHCDPRNTGVSPGFYEDIQAMRQWIMYELEVRYPQYFETLVFGPMYSLNTEQTRSVVSTLISLRGHPVSDDINEFIEQVNSSSHPFVTSIV